MNSNEHLRFPHAPGELVDLLRHAFVEAMADPEGQGPSRATASQLAAAAARHGIGSPAQLLPAIRAAWSAVPAADTVPDDQREVLLHRVTSAVIATYYESR